MDLASILNQELSVSCEGIDSSMVSMSSHLEAEAMESSRPPRRRAANRANYDLSATWLNEYLIEEDIEPILNSRVEGDTEEKDREQRLNAIRAQNHMAEDSGEDSDSDEYKDEEEHEPGPYERKRSRRNSDDFFGARRKKPRRAGSTKQPKMGRVSKSEIQGLVDYIRHTLDWQKVAIISSTIGKTQRGNPTGRRDLEISEVESSVGDIPTVTQIAAVAAKLRDHWDGYLSHKIVAMHRK